MMPTPYLNPAQNGQRNAIAQTLMGIAQPPPQSHIPQLPQQGAPSPPMPGGGMPSPQGGMPPAPQGMPPPPMGMPQAPMGMPQAPQGMSPQMMPPQG